MNRKKQKVFILIKGLGLGGAEKLLALSLPYVDRDHFDYEIGYILPWKDALVPDIESFGVPVFCLNQSKPYDLRVVPRLIKLLKQRNVDLLHSHLPYAGILGRAVRRFTPVKGVVYTEHNVWERYHRVTASLNRATYRMNDAVIAVSKEVENSIRSNAHINGKPKLDTILNGVDVDYLSAISADPHGVKAEFGIPMENSIVIHVGNFTPKKRHEDLVKAAKAVLQQRPNVTFILVGTGPLEDEVKNQAKSLGIDSNLVFTGLRTDVPRLMAASNMFVLPSKYEGLPISLLEAMSVGKPVVVSDVGGVSEVVDDGVSGLLIEPLQPHALAEGILNLLNNPQLVDTLVANGRKRVQEQFSIQRMVHDMEAVYHNVLGTKEMA